MSRVYYEGETMRQNVIVTTKKKVAIDPDTIVISIVDPMGTKKVDEEAMIKDGITEIEKGKYHYDYLIGVSAPKGQWSTEVKAIKDFTQIEQDNFTVVSNV